MSGSSRQGSTSLVKNAARTEGEHEQDGGLALAVLDGFVAGLNDGPGDLLGDGAAGCSNGRRRAGLLYEVHLSVVPRAEMNAT